MIHASVQSGGNDALEEVLACIKELTSYEVLIGVPEENNQRKLSTEDSSNRVTNAELAFIHSYGSGINRIPARPFLEPALEDGKDQLGILMEDAVAAALDGDEAGLRHALGEVGLRGQSLAMAWFTSPKNGWAPNAPITLEGGWMRNYKTGAPVNVKGKNKKGGDPRPLIDTEELRKSITYSVEKT